MTRRRSARMALSALAALAITMTATVPARATGASRRLPPPERKALARIFDPMLEDLGLRTTRARLQNRQSYAIDPNGRHLAIYVEPIDESYTDAEYVENYDDVAKIFVPYVFNRWKGLKSFDVCQEPRPGDDANPEPPPITQITVSRKGSKFVRWRTATLTELLLAAIEHPATKPGIADYSVFFDHTLSDQPALIDARTRAAQGTGSDS